MGLFSIFRRHPPRRSKNSYELTDEDRAHSNRIRQINQQIKETQRNIELLRAQADLQDVQDELNDYYEDEEDEQPYASPRTPEEMFMQILEKAMAKQQASTPPQHAHTPQAPAQGNVQVELSQDQIRQLVTQIPPDHLAQAKRMTPAQLKQYISTHYPQLAAPTIEQAIQVIHNG